MQIASQRKIRAQKNTQRLPKQKRKEKREKTKQQLIQLMRALRINDTILIQELFKNLNTHKLSSNITRILNDSLIFNIIDILKVIESLVQNYPLHKYKTHQIFYGIQKYSKKFSGQTKYDENIIQTLKKVKFQCASDYFKIWRYQFIQRNQQKVEQYLNPLIISDNLREIDLLMDILLMFQEQRVLKIQTTLQFIKKNINNIKLTEVNLVLFAYHNQIQFISKSLKQSKIDKVDNIITKIQKRVNKRSSKNKTKQLPERKDSSDIEFQDKHSSKEQDSQEENIRRNSSYKPIYKQKQLSSKQISPYLLEITQTEQFKGILENEGIKSQNKPKAQKNSKKHLSKQQKRFLKIQSKRSKKKQIVLDQNLRAIKNRSGVSYFYHNYSLEFVEAKFMQNQQLLCYLVEYLVKQWKINEASYLTYKYNLVNHPYLSSLLPSLKPIDKTIECLNNLFVNDYFGATQLRVLQNTTKQYVQLIDFNILEEDVKFIDRIDASYDFAQDQLLKSQLIAFDIQFCSAISQFQKQTNEIIQIATQKYIFIFDIPFLQQQERFIHLLQKIFYVGNDKQTVLGFAFDSSDSICLRKIMMKQSTKYIPFKEIKDLQKVKKGGSLKTMAQKVFNKSFSKYQQISGWNNRPLRKSQLHYAALDAYVLIQIFQKLELRTNQELNKPHKNKNISRIRSAKSKEDSKKNNKNIKQKTQQQKQ